MALIATDSQHYNNIAQKLRTLISTDVKYKPSEMADAIQTACNIRYKAGQKNEYNYFWDNYQSNPDALEHGNYGTRTDYKNSFSGAGWTEEILKPKYSMYPTDCYMMFRQNKAIKDFNVWQEENNITVDFSNATNMNYAFSESSIVTIGDVNDLENGYKLDVSNCTPVNCLFEYCYDLKNLSIKVSSKTSFGDYAFKHCRSLKEMRVNGVLGNNLDFHWSEQLSKDSISSIISALSDTSGGYIYLSKTAVNKAFEMFTGAADGSSSNEWIELITPKSNGYDGKWTISLV